MPVHLQREIEKLKKMILSLGANVEQSFKNAVNSVNSKDNELATSVILDDVKIDAMEVDIEEECLKILALYQPVAIDLRFIVAVLKINNELERIGDLASNIAERVKHLASYPGTFVDIDFQDMGDIVKSMLKDSLDALVNFDINVAINVPKTDDKVDALNSEMHKFIKQGIQDNPEQISPLLDLLSISRHLERIADCATNIAEDVIYMINGQIVRHSNIAEQEA